MRNLLMLTAAGSALALAVGGIDAATLSPDGKVFGAVSLVQKTQKGDDKGPGARGQEGGGKGMEPGVKGRESGAGQDKGGEKGAAQQGQREKGAAGQQQEKGAAREQRGEKGAERRGDSRGDRRTRVDIDVERRQRKGGRDVDIRERGSREGGYGYTGGGGLSCQEVLRRYKQCVGR